MDNKKLTLSKEHILPYFEKWELLKPEIQQRYDMKENDVIEWMEQAIVNYEELLLACSVVSGMDRRTKMEPLNGEERLQFIKTKMVSPFALVQLTLLHTELRKKIARFLK